MKMTHMCFEIWGLALFRNSDPIINTGLKLKTDHSPASKQQFHLVLLRIPELLE